MKAVHAAQYGITCAVIDGTETVTAAEVIEYCTAIGAVRLADGTEYCVQLRADVGPELWTGESLRRSLQDRDLGMPDDAPGLRAAFDRPRRFTRGEESGD